MGLDFLGLALCGRRYGACIDNLKVACKTLNPCKHESTCSVDDDGKTHCLCTKGYDGVTCGHETDEVRPVLWLK
jgi:hypothetical protein